MIKRVVNILQSENPDLQTFATLSPVPGFMGWLRVNVAKPALTWLSDRAPDLHRVLGEDSPPSIEVVSRHTNVLQTACAQYLLEAKKGILPLDPVARFHLRNGARLERINPHGDTSLNGLGRSAGVLVNYVYATDELATNHESFVNTGAIARHPTIDAALAARY